MFTLNDKSYAEIFSLRAISYDEAMRAYPKVRSDEFGALLAWADIKNGQTILDIPSGGGYLADFIHNNLVNLIQIDPSSSFGSMARSYYSDTKIIQSALNQLPLKSKSVDIIISMVGLHHEHDRQSIFSEWRRVIKQNGHLFIAEVEGGSKVAAFLNGFVDRYNPIGHHGLFIDDTFLEETKSAGWQSVRSERTNSHWHFSDFASASEYFRLLFDLQLADDSDIINAIQQELDVYEDVNRISICWPLRQLKLEVACT